MMLDLESVRLFVLVAECGNFTRAAEVAGTVQPVVSQRLKSLETRLGHKLLSRTSRFVQPTAEGAAFLDRARTLLAAHEDAVRISPEPALHFAIGISDNAVGAGIGQVFRRVRAALPVGAMIEIRTGLSDAIRSAFDAGDFDAAIVRREARAQPGEVLGSDPLGWHAHEGWTLPLGAPVPLATLGPSCGVRAAAVRELERAGMAWRESFIGGSCAALMAGALAGLGIAPMGRVASGRAPDMGPELGLPALPRSAIVLLSRASPEPVMAAVRTLAASIRASLR